MKIIRNYLIYWVIALIGVLLSPQVLAWNAQGHRVIGEIAYANLTPETRRSVDTLLEQSGLLPENTSFAEAGVWADDIRAQGVEAFNAWHFINLQYVQDGVPYYRRKPENIVWATQQSVAAVQNTHLPTPLRGFFLLMLLHMVGDVHQPLHSVTLFSKDFPHGDRGGNAYPIRHAHADNLHRLWDIGLGLLLTQQSAATLAEKLQQQYPISTVDIKVLEPAVWAEESYQIAGNMVYNIDIKGKPSSNYIKQGQAVTEQQLVRAGYRLAALLSEMSYE